MSDPKIRLVIVDDEQPARERARRLLSQFADIDIIAEAKSGREALPLIEDLQPDVVLLDINMPEIDGLRLLEALDDPPSIIFATAYEQHAIRAFELEAVDYLLKPFSGERLGRALDRVRRQLAMERHREGTGAPKRISAQNGADTEMLEPGCIDAARIEEGVVFILRNDGERLIWMGSLQELEEQLPEGNFLRSSRQGIVNLDAIVSYSTKNDGRIELKLRSGELEFVSRRRARFIRSHLR